MHEPMDGERRARMEHLVANLMRAHLIADRTRLEWYIDNAETVDLYRLSREMRKLADEMSDAVVRRRQEEEAQSAEDARWDKTTSEHADKLTTLANTIRTKRKDHTP